MNGIPTNTQNALINHLETPGTSSKKYTMVLIGLIIVVFIFTGSVVASIIKPEIAAQITSLANVIVPSISLLVGIYAGSQAAVEWKTTDGITKSGSQP